MKHPRKKKHKGHRKLEKKWAMQGKRAAAKAKEVLNSLGLRLGSREASDRFQHEFFQALPKKRPSTHWKKK
jgi:hypothetical protein